MNRDKIFRAAKSSDLVDQMQVWGQQTQETIGAPKEYLDEAHRSCCRISRPDRVHVRVVEIDGVKVEGFLSIKRALMDRIVAALKEEKAKPPC